MPGLPAEHAPATAVGDLAELLDVDVDQLAGPVPFVAADHLAGGSIQPGQTSQAVAGQHRCTVEGCKPSR